MHLSTPLLLALVALVTIYTPGPTVLLAPTNGTRYGVRRSLPGTLGAVVYDFVLVGAVALGLGTVFAGMDFSVMLVFAYVFAYPFAYTFAGARAVRLLRVSAAKWIDRVCGGALALAGPLAFYRHAAV